MSEILLGNLRLVGEPCQCAPAPCGQIVVTFHSGSGVRMSPAEFASLAIRRRGCGGGEGVAPSPQGHAHQRSAVHARDAEDRARP